MSAAYLPDAGDLIWAEFDPALGRKPAGRRPALVVSPASFADRTGLAFVCPITSRVRPFPSSVVLPEDLPASWEILLSHIRTINVTTRHVRFAGGSVPLETRQWARAKLSAFITI